RLVRNRACHGFLEWLRHQFPPWGCETRQKTLWGRHCYQFRPRTQFCLSGHCSRSRFSPRSSDDENPSIGSLVTVQGTAWYFVRLDQVKVMTFIVDQLRRVSVSNT